MPSDIDIPFRHSNASITSKLKKGKIIIKRTSSYKSFKRAVKIDYQNEYFMNLEKEKHKNKILLRINCFLLKHFFQLLLNSSNLLMLFQV